MKAITIFLVEDHRLLRDAWKVLFKTQPSIAVLGEADNAQDAYIAIDKLRPEVVLLDINLKGDSGTSLITLLRNTMPFIKIIVVSMHKEYAFVKKMFRYGINGFVTKDSSVENLFNAIAKVIKGEIFLSDDLQSMILKHSLYGHSGINLTFSELEILESICLGRSNKEIAIEHQLSIKTVEGHKTNLYKKTNTKSKTELIKFAAENNIF